MTIVTGFLGAGKTTLLRRFLTSPEGRNTAVIINEFGAVGIDDTLVRDALVRGTADEVALLGNGCLCCVTRTDLQLTLRRLVHERARGELAPFARVVIETSGLADPGPILQTFSTDRALGAEFFIEVVLTVIDAVGGLATLERSPEARKQVILADRLVITKTDLADDETVARLHERLSTLNPHAAIDTAIDGALDPRCLIEADAGSEIASRGAEGNSDRGMRRMPRSHAGFIAEAVGGATAAEHMDGIVSFVFTEDAPFAWDTFARAMETLIALRGPDLLRAKGFLSVEGCRGPVLVQFVQHLAHPPVELAAWPDASRASRLVFITRNIGEAQVRQLFGAVRALAAAPL